MDVAKVRVAKASQNRNITEAEEATWKYISRYLDPSDDWLFESTGTIWRIKQLWTKERIDHGIYTIKFTAAIETCVERANARLKPTVPGYDLDEETSIHYEASCQASLPANALINTECSTNELEERYKTLEAYIITAKKYFTQNYRASRCVIGGYNKIERD